jgi:hypothetical protein
VLEQFQLLIVLNQVNTLRIADLSLAWVDATHNKAFLGCGRVPKSGCFVYMSFRNWGTEKGAAVATPSCKNCEIRILILTTCNTFDIFF